MFLKTLLFISISTDIQSLVCGVSVEIDGNIDLGPNWNYEYKVKPLRSKKNRINTMKLEETKSQDDTPSNKIDQSIDTDSSENVFDNPHVVKDDKKINDFSFHVYKQTLKVFDSIKQKVDPTLSHKVDFIARSYDEKFRKYVNETLNRKIKTRLGTQKVILNTIDTSNRFLKRLVNYFIGEVNKDTALRSKMVAANVLLKEVDKELDLEYEHVCNKFSICRTTRGFNNFMTEVLTVLIKNDNKRLKLASDALTEVLKATDVSTIMEPVTEAKFRHKISDIEAWDADITRAVFTILKNIIAMKNHPIKVMVQGDAHINSTVVLLEIIDEFDKVLASNEDNNLEWTDLKNSLNDWSENQRQDILEIMQGLVGHVMKNGVNKMDAKKQANMKRKFALLLGV